jgi:hypothetical protein
MPGRQPQSILILRMRVMCEDEVLGYAEPDGLLSPLPSPLAGPLALAPVASTSAPAVLAAARYSAAASSSQSKAQEEREAVST